MRKMIALGLAALSAVASAQGSNDTVRVDFASRVTTMTGCSVGYVDSVLLTATCADATTDAGASLPQTAPTLDFHGDAPGFLYDGPCVLVAYTPNAGGDYYEVWCDTVFSNGFEVSPDDIWHAGGAPTASRPTAATPRTRAWT